MRKSNNHQRFYNVQTWKKLAEAQAVLLAALVTIVPPAISGLGTFFFVKTRELNPCRCQNCSDETRMDKAEQGW